MGLSAKFSVSLFLVSCLVSSVGVATLDPISRSGFISSEGLPNVLIGEAKFVDGTPAYTETHTFEFKEARLVGLSTEYRLPRSAIEGESAVIAVMKHTFPLAGYLPDYSYSDLRNSIEHRLTLQIEKGTLTLLRKSKGKEKTKTLPVEGRQAAGQGVYFWILANLDGILKKERAYVKFVVPGLLDQYSFHADLIKTENGRHTIRVELDNWFFRLFASKTQFDIDAKSRRLLEYRGPSNIADTQRKYRDVVITYR